MVHGDEDDFMDQYGTWDEVDASTEFFQISLPTRRTWRCSAINFNRAPV